MANNKNLYRCSECNSSEYVTAGEESPLCCNKTMVPDPLPPCTAPGHAEMARNEDESGACDDGRGHTG